METVFVLPNVRLGRLFGADIELHASFFLLALLFAAMTVSGRGWDALPMMGAFYLSGFASVLVHEYGHIFVARLHAVDCRKVTLHGLGGLAHLDEELGRPRAAFLVAFAGPVTSMILAGLLWTASWVTESYQIAWLLFHLALINVVIALFNLIPAYPLDGGRMLHALLQTLMSKDRADTLSGIASQSLGVAMVVGGILLGLLNVVIVGAALFFLAPYSLGRGWLYRKRERT